MILLCVEPRLKLYIVHQGEEGLFLCFQYEPEANTERAHVPKNSLFMSHTLFFYNMCDFRRFFLIQV